MKLLNLSAADMNALAHYPINRAGTVVQTEDGQVWTWSGSIWESDGSRPVRMGFRNANNLRE